MVQPAPPSRPDPATLADPAESTGLYLRPHEHGMVTTGPGSTPVRGDRLTLIPHHCVPTVDRYGRMWLVREDTAVGTASITARGRPY